MKQYFFKFFRDCAITADYGLGCNNSMGGMLEFYIMSHSDFELGTYTAAGGAATAIVNAAAKKFFRYQLPRGTGSANSKATTSQDKGTTVYEETLKFVINTMSAAMSQELAKIIGGRWVVVVVDRNLNGWLYGLETGLTGVSNDSTTGTAGSDRNGYSLDLAGQERATPLYVPRSLHAGLMIAGV